MTKGIFSKFAVFKSISLIMFVLSVVLSGSVLTNTANAQGVSGDSASWEFVPLEFDISHGDSAGTFKDLPAVAGVHNVKFVSAILSATDEDKDVYGSNNLWKDGSVDSTTGQGKLLKELFYNVNTSNQGPIIANIESSDINDTSKPNEPLNMVAVIQNVSSEIVSALRNEALGGTTAQSIINLITAEFSSNIFAADDPNNPNARGSVGDTFANVRPTSVTGVLGINGKTPADLGFLTTNAAGETIDYSTVIIVRWDSISNTALKASATNIQVAASNFGATITINGLGTSIAPSNQIGLEVDGFADANTVGAVARQSGPAITYTNNVPTVNFKALYDTVSTSYYFNGTTAVPALELNTLEAGVRPPIAMFNPFGANSLLTGANTVLNFARSGVIRLTTETPSVVQLVGKPLQFRASDIVVIQSKFNINANLDGEPDAYYGSNSDPIVFGDLKTGNDVLTARYNNLNSAGEINNSSSKIKVTITSKADSEVVNVPSFTTVSLLSGEGTNAAAVGDNAVLDVTFPISNTLQTSGESEKVNFSVLIQDDIGYATTSVNAENNSYDVFHVDTLAPIASDITLRGEINETISTSSTGYRGSRKISGATTAYDEMVVSLGLQTNGENSNDFAQWANVTITPSTDAVSNWVNNASAISLNVAKVTATVDTAGSAGLVHGSSERNLVNGVSGGTVLGVSTFLRIRHTASQNSNISNAYVIASVSDDARNPAIAWVGTSSVASELDDRIAFTRTTRIRQSSTGIVNFSGQGNRSPAPFISSATSNIVALNNNNPTVFRTISSSTLVVDNNPPNIRAATLTVLRAPENFWTDVTSTSSDGLSRYAQILNSTEALIAEANAAKLVELGTTTLKAHGRSIIQSTRATSANVNSGTQNQSGSPLRLVIQFSPNGSPQSKSSSNNPTPIFDLGGTEHFTSSGENANSTGKSFVESNYKFEIHSDVLGFATDTDLAKTLDSDWSLVDAQVISGTVAFATFENTIGIREVNIVNNHVVETGNNRSIDEASVAIRIFDNVINSPTDIAEPQEGNSFVTALNIYSSTIIVDVSTPVVNRSLGDFNGDNLGRGFTVSGYGAAASTILFITNTGGRSFTQIVTDLSAGTAPGSGIGQASGIYRHIGAFAGNVAGNVPDASTWPLGFVNSSTAFLGDSGFLFSDTQPFDVNENGIFVADSSRTVQAGYMIIIGATFSEPNTGDGASDQNLYQRFANTGRNDLFHNTLVGAFPFIISASEARGERDFDSSQSVDAIDSASTEFGNSWKTISADFSDFVVGAKAILPTVSSVVPSTTGTGSVDPAGILSATWFYQVDTSNVNTSISSSQVRAVTLYARDLSGNVSYDVIPVGLADFSVPVVTIEELSMRVPSRGLNNVLLEGTTLGTSTSSVSAATFNKNDATMRLVAKVTGSTLKTDGGELFANLSNLGGGSSVNPSATSTIPANISVTNITAGTIYYATWDIGPINGSTVNRSGKITVSAIGSSLTQTNKDTTKIDVDQAVPSFNAADSITRKVIEENTAGTNTNSSFDTKGDSVLRPGQTFTLAIRLNITESTAGTDGDNTGKDIQVTGDFSSFGLGTAEPKLQMGIENSTVYSATWQLTVPSNKSTGLAQAVISATDPAGNAATITTESVFIQSGQPVVVSNILSSSKAVGSATSSAFPALKSFFEVANVNNSASVTYPNNNLNPLLIKNNEQITIFAEAFISSDGFTNVGISADFSQVSNSAPTRQNLGADEDASAIVNNGSTIVFPTEKEAGNNIDATWTVALTDLNDTGSAANIILTATVGDSAAFASVGNATTVVPVMVDTTAPQVSLVNSWYKSGKTVTESSLFSSTPNGATAGVIVYATLTDASVIRGYMGSPIAGANSAGITGNDATASLMTLNAADFGASGSVVPAYWTLSDRTGVFADTAGVHLITSGSSFTEIAASTATVLTAYYGEIPESVRVFAQIPASAIPAITVTATNKSGAKLVASVSDSVGNVGTANSAEVEADGTAPVVQKDPFRIAIVPGTKHIPATFDAAGDIVTNTRVSNGSQLTGKFTVSDSPDKSDAMVVFVTAANFGATSFEVTSLATSDISGFAKNPGNFGWSFTATPSNASDVTVFATFTAGDKGTNSQSFDLKDIPDPDGVIDFGYNQARLNSLDEGFFANGASLEVQVIDSESNSVAGKKSIALDYDNEPPKFTQTSDGTNEVAILALNSLAAVNALTRADKATVDNRGKLRNLNTSQWVVVAGTIVVDGTDDSHLTKFDVNWEEALEQDIGRLVAGSETSGSVVVVNSVTPAARAVRFVTNAVQIRTTASPLGAQDIKVTFADFFGNEATTTLDKVAINASGPSANEVRLFVNGVSQLSGTSLLGIGNGGPDSASSSFELAPGDTIEVEAVVNTVGTGRAPQFIYANFSSLYPPELLHSVDQILPSATSVTADGTVLARWTHITGNYQNITATNAIAFNDIQLTSAQISSPKFNNGIIAGVTLSNATSLTLGSGAINDLGASQAILNNLSGLPLIQVQQNADPTMSASIGIFVDENAPLNLFGSTNTESTKFAVDTQTPIASWYVPWELITRQLTPSITGLTGYDKSTGAVNEAKGRARVGFPTTPVLTALDILNTGDENNDLNSIFNVPARVRGGDTVYIIANVTNANISGNGDDKFRPYPGTSFDSSTVFDINSTNLDVNADLSQFGGSAFSNVNILSTTTGSDSTPAFNVLTKNQNFSGKATQIAATFALTIASNLGTTAATSRERRDATFVITDDAGNNPFDTFETVGTNQTVNKVKKLVRPGAIGVDNRAPTISGTLDVINLSNNNVTLQNGSAISGGSKLKITANINDSVDNPLDVLNNPNWGSVTLSAEGITLSNDDVILLATEALLSGNAVSVPFSVDIPAVETGVSTSEFQFRISATDSLGNATSRLSNDKFKFDARPDIKWVDASANTINQTVTYHAGGPALVVSANSFDVGGVSEVVISIDAADAASQLAALSQDGITFDSTFSGTGTTGTENVNVPVTITSLPTIPTERLFTFLIADVTDVSGATNTANITVNYNRPALFDSAFALTAVNSSGADIAPATVISGSGSLETEGDIRELTITEGSTVTISLAASDGDSDAIVYSATGSAFDSIFEDFVLDATSNVFTFKPGFKALTGDETSKTVDAVFTVNDSKHPTSDTVTIRITINAEAAVPVVDITSINVTNLRTNVISSPTVSLNDTVNIPENSHVEIVLVATDAGNENLTFTTDKNTDLVVATEITNSTGIATATVTFNLGFNDADIIISESAIDPTLLTFNASNSVNTGSATKNIDVTNSSQPGVITSTFTRNGGPAQSIIDGGSITASAGDVIVIDINVADPDQIDRFGFPEITPVADESIFTISSEFVGVVNNGVEVNNRVTITVASTVAQDSTATINYSAQKDTLDAIISTATFFVEASSTPPEPVTQIDEIVLAQGAGGSQLVNVRNFDSGSATPVNGIIDQFRSIGPVARATWGGGEGRGTNVSIGDVDNDGDLDYALTFGAITTSATFPNQFIVRDVATKSLVGHARRAFPPTGGSLIEYATGELKSAIGDFLTDGQNLLAIAQGTGSARSLVRIFQYTGNPAPNSWSVVAQFQPLDNTPNNNNANGGVSLDAADVDGDGLDELIVGQTASSTSLTQFTVIDVAADGNHVRHNFVAFAAGFRGGGGIDIAAADLNSDGTNELVFTSGALNGSAELGSLVTVVRPVVTNNVVTGYERPGNSIVQLVAGDSNPGGGLSVAAGEFDGDATNGQELLIGSGTGAPQSFYRVVKVSYDGTDVTGTTFLVGPPNNFSFTQPAFLDAFNPTSGAVNVEAANHTVRN